ncbi:MAG: VOC family protein [Steroidobacteraceae bacterium]
MIVPMLICADGAAEIEFCKQAFGAIELSRRIGQAGEVVHATLKIGEDIFMVHGQYPHLKSMAPADDGSSPVVIYLYIDNVDAVIERAVEAGAQVVLPTADQPWGDRVGRVMDPAGHVWNIATHLYG